MSVRKTFPGLVGSLVAQWTLNKLLVRVHIVPETDQLDLPPVAHHWVIKGFGMSSRVCVTGASKALVCPAVSV